MIFKALLTATFFVSSVTLARGKSVDTLPQWFNQQAHISLQGLLRNVNPAGTAAGTVIASPSRQNPDYYAHWTRDAALVMDTVVTLYERSNTAQEKNYYLTALLNYIQLARAQQSTGNASGGPDFGALGEPKFNVDGTPYMGPWGRPQNDGPALRAITLLRLATVLMNEGRVALVRTLLYDGGWPSNTVVKVDLEYVANQWREPSFDLWEEVNGQHFYTRMVQRKALLRGARLAQTLGDGRAAQWYYTQAQQLEQEITKHWNAGRGYILATLDPVGGNDRDKHSQLDIAVVLAALHADNGDGFFTPGNDAVLATAEKIRQSFKSIYNVNRREMDFEGQPMGAAMGRYPEDRYDGVTVTGLGNPWYLATFAMAEMIYRSIHEFSNRGQIKFNSTNAAFFTSHAPMIAFNRNEILTARDPRWTSLMSALRDSADTYVRRVRTHTPLNGALAEQFNRDNGYAQGARDLTWSYASVLTAFWARPN